MAAPAIWTGSPPTALNVRRRSGPRGSRLVEQELGGGRTQQALHGSSIYTATHALWLDQVLQMDAQKGALVSFVARQIMLVHPIRDRSALDAATQMSMLTVSHPQDFQWAPGAINPFVYWWCQGQLTQLGARWEEE